MTDQPAPPPPADRRRPDQPGEPPGQSSAEASPLGARSDGSSPRDVVLERNPAAESPTTPRQSPVIGTVGEPGSVPGPLEEFGRIRDEVGKVVVGQGGVLSGMLVALLADGHVLLEGVPGTAKTVLVKSIAAAISVDAARVQFTPDLMPSDVLGQMVFENGTFRFRQGPVFTNFLLADEINRTPPKTQAALLEAMEERQVSVDGVRHVLPQPFMVIATQNPVEYEGTYPLPEAQLDRFLLKLNVDYPAEGDEVEILRRHHSGMDPHDPIAAGVERVADARSLSAAQDLVEAVVVEPPAMQYIVRLIRSTRSSPSFSLGVSPRGGTALLKASKAWAWLTGRTFVTPDEVKAMAKPCLRHRVMLRPELEIEGVTTDQVLDGLLAQVPVA